MMWWVKILTHQEIPDPGLPVGPVSLTPSPTVYPLAVVLSQYSHRLGALLRVASSADGFGLGQGTAEGSVHHLAVQPPAAAILGELGPWR